MAADPAVRDHQAWLGYLQPDGLVVSAAALVDAQVILPRDTRDLQGRFLEQVEEVAVGEVEAVPAICDLAVFFRDFLEWPAELLAGSVDSFPIPDELRIPLPEFGDLLEPTFGLRDLKATVGRPAWLLLVQQLPLGADLDVAHVGDTTRWSASHARRFERLLRETRIPIGVLANRTHLRLIYAPRGENAGSLTFPVQAMTEVTGRPILAALELLLGRYRLFAAPTEVRLPALLEKSREYQSAVSTRLAGQVLDGLYQLLRGLQAANDRSKGDLLRDVLGEDPDQVYAGLLNVLMRLVFLLYAEDRGLMPTTGLYAQNYSVHGLFEKLRTDAQGHPDTMDHRYGAWARLLTLFRALHGGCRHPQLAMPSRQGYLFDPDRFPFLEGRVSVPQPGVTQRVSATATSPHRVEEAPAVYRALGLDKPKAEAPMEVVGAAARLPLISDGVVWRVLEKLLILGGERLSYRTLDVEQIGSVYETMMGFRIELAKGPTIALKPAKARGAPPAVNLSRLLEVKPADRPKWLREAADQKLEGTTAGAVENASDIEGLLAALERRIARNATPGVVPKGAMVLQPSDERRRSGSHYTPRSLTEPIVRRTLKPILDRLGPNPTPAQILDLKVCDPAVGSGAFLVAACRELGDALVMAWHAHKELPMIPPDEDEVLHARRLVAQRCLYGVDRNPVAADLAKLSLWLATLARDHPFTFLDHSIRCGDSLVGLTRRQIEDFHWKPAPKRAFGQDIIERRLEAATAARREILEAGDDMLPILKRQKLAVADQALDLVRLAGDLPITAFFAAATDGARGVQRDALLAKFVKHIYDADFANTPDEATEVLRKSGHPISPFHWEIEFPEVSQREASGFDAFIGNPPFLGGKRISTVLGARYRDWLAEIHADSNSNSDLVAHFFRRAFAQIRRDGCLGLIATNTIAQGDTRATGLRYLCTHGATIYAAIKRLKWPGEAAVVVSVVHVVKGAPVGPFELNGKLVNRISAYLLHAGGDENPARLQVNAGKSYVGCYLRGMGFTFDDTDTKNVASSLAEMRCLLERDPKNQACILPYIGGEEVNDSPTHANHRYTIYFRDFPLKREDLSETWAESDEFSRAEWLRRGVVPLDYSNPVAADWPDLLAVVEQKVRPEREQLSDSSVDRAHKLRWWRFANDRPEMNAAIAGLPSVIVISRNADAGAFTLLETGQVYSEQLIVFAVNTMPEFCTLQSRIHDIWMRIFASSMKDDMRYTPTDCFETFPFPVDPSSLPTLQGAGSAYFSFRAALMVEAGEGLTRTYNRFHDPQEASPGIRKLRELHAAMDRAVLDAYGWTDIAHDCDFFLEWEDEKEEPGGRRKKPWRLRWPDEVRDQVLARLLALNVGRAAEEQRVGSRASLAVQAIARERRGRRVPKSPKSGDLFH